MGLYRSSSTFSLCFFFFARNLAVLLIRVLKEINIKFNTGLKVWRFVFFCPGFRGFQSGSFGICLCTIFPRGLFACRNWMIRIFFFLSVSILLRLEGTCWTEAIEDSESYCYSSQSRRFSERRESPGVGIICGGFWAGEGRALRWFVWE